MTEFYYETILTGLSKVPTPNNPGKLIVTGHSQAILTDNDSNNVIMAGCEYGKGKIIVSSHSCYLEWINEYANGIKKDFMNRVKQWLTGDEMTSRFSIGNLAYITEGFVNFKILMWDSDVSLSDDIKSAILEYINQGGININKPFNSYIPINFILNLKRCFNCWFNAMGLSPVKPW